MTLKRPTNRRSISSSADCRRHHDIDHEIRKFEDAVRELKSKRNALAIISKLPPEILSKVFILCSQACAADGNTLQWMKVSHVSHHWRAVALGCPALWSTPVFSSSAANEMLKRSKMAPLTLKADLTLMTPKMIEAVQNGLKQISRVEHLSFTASNGTMDKLLGHLEQPAPFLQSLSISNSYPGYHYTSERYAFPQSFLKGEAPRLRDLELIRCSIPWDSPLFHNLTHLKIFDTGEQFRPTMDELLDMLEMIPMLESIDFTDCLPTVADNSTSAPAPLRSVNLPNISSIHLSSQTLECSNFLNHISFPATATVKIVCRGTDATNHDFSSLNPTLTNWLQGSEYTSTSPPIKAFLVEHLNTNSIRFQAWNEDAPDSALPLSTPMLDMELNWRQFESVYFEQVISTIRKALPLSDLETLHVVQRETLASASWATTFGSLSKVQRLQLQGWYGHELVKALRVEMVDEGTQQSSVSFPALKTLALDDVDFFMDGTSMLDPLRSALTLRRKKDAPLRDLSLRRCSGVLSADVDSLRKIVGSVPWDMLEIGDDESLVYDSDEGFLADPNFSTYYDTDEDAF